MTVYLDYNATTPVDSLVLEAMLPFLQTLSANPSAVHAPGRQARAAMDVAREQVAALVNAHPSQVVFTSGGSEANSLAILGCARGMGFSHIACSAIEHPAVLEACYALQRQGVRFDELATGPDGLLRQSALRTSLQQGLGLLSVMLANNETGVLQQVQEIAVLARAHGAVVHTDAVQALGKIPVDFRGLGVQMMTLSAHKIYGPKGVGALVMDKQLKLEPQIYGGGQEKGLRSGTENVAAIVGFGKAAEIAKANLQQMTRLQQLRDQLEQGLMQLGGVVVFARHADRLPNTSFFSVAGIDGETLLMNLDLAGFAVSSGSACASKSEQPSHVLMAMGVEKDIARGAIRVSLGRATSADDIHAFLQALQQQISMLRSLSAVLV
ncbi:MAG: cysteine desulfurase [Gammaproteobacteria bacterium]|nr:cysteine desulfurase [Gammaproteobacteria bacterium]